MKCGRQKRKEMPPAVSRAVRYLVDEAKNYTDDDGAYEVHGKELLGVAVEVCSAFGQTLEEVLK